ncbi:MAG: lysophospholipid acyltransferase family protein [Lachnospiraceae bacterium]
MNQVTTKEKISRNKSITDGKVVMLFKDLLRPVLSLIAGFRVPYQVVIEQPCRLLPDKPVIYAVNHSCFADTPIMGRITPQRSYILLGKQRLGFSDWLYFILNGVIFVDRKDKEDMAASKLAMIAYLSKSRSVVMFPEGTWNLTENRLMLPMKWGVINVAKESGGQIVPTVLEYSREQKKCFVRFGEPMVVSPDDRQAEAITALRDTMAAMRWAFWERNGLFSREELNLDAQRQKLFYSVEEYPPIDWAYESSCIYHPHTEPEDVWQSVVEREKKRDFQQRF